jgi:hypothetical protein
MCLRSAIQRVGGDSLGSAFGGCELDAVLTWREHTFLQQKMTVVPSKPGDTICAVAHRRVASSPGTYSCRVGHTQLKTLLAQCNGTRHSLNGSGG